ncbi:MAG: polysaccharide deacetylase family protein [Myxococcota bacterium]
MPSLRQWTVGLLCAFALAAGAVTSWSLGRPAPLPEHPPSPSLVRTVAPSEPVPHRYVPPHAPPMDPGGRAFAEGQIMTGATAHRLILFTFDDGPNRHTTPELLDVLDSYGVRAVFFFTAERILGETRRQEYQQEIAREIVRRGHLVANHTVHHVSLLNLNRAEIRLELTEAEHIFERVVGERPWLFRPPGGNHTPRIDAVIAERGYTTMLWNLGTGDTQVRTPEEVFSTWRKVQARREREFGERGGIILLHDIHEWAVQAFSMIMDELLARNCRLLADGEELYDVVDDPAPFFAAASSDPSSEAPPGSFEPEVQEARQAILREETEQRCSAIAEMDRDALSPVDTEVPL